MKNKCVFAGFIIILMILGLNLTGCGDNDASNKGALSGTYSGKIENYDINCTFSGSNYTIKIDGIEYERGSYTVTGNTVRFTPTWNEDNELFPYTGTLSGSNNSTLTALGLTLTKENNNSGGGADKITFNPNGQWGWQAIYESSSLFNGNKITQGNTYTFTYSFTSNVPMDYLQAVLIDNNNGWTELSGYIKVKENIAANTVVSGTFTITATGTATNTTASANRLVLQAGTGTLNQPTLTFTALSLGNGNSGGNNSGSNGGGTETGLYVGIIGFNENVTKREIGLLNSGNKYQFQTFINSLTSKAATGLYYAVDNGLNMLQSAILPNDLTNVAIVTFTDGLDNVSIDLNTNYNSRDAYRDALRNKISTTKIKNLNINAYSIGIRGGDVQDIDAFRAGLDALASTGNRYEVTSMTEVNNTFKTIANSLYNETQTQSVKLRITSGYDDGTKIRFTFDSVTDAANSNLYIEGIYKRNGTNRSLENVSYQGLNSSSGTTVSGSLSGVYVTFTFQNTSTTSGGSVDTDNTQQWEYITSQSRWQKNSEFGQTGDTEIIVDRKSAVIMLVLDCTTSLDAGGANGFSEMKVAANNFIDVLMSGQH